MRCVIGVTGGTGCGKSTVSSILKELGAKIIDADIVSREIVKKGQPALAEIKETFGGGVILADGSLDRKKLGAIVFADKKKLDILNKITHKYIIEEITKAELSFKDGIFIIDAALLFQTGLDKLCNKTISVVSGEDVRMKRLNERDGLTLNEAKNRISSQENEIYYKNHSDYVIENNGTIDELKSETERILKEIM